MLVGAPNEHDAPGLFVVFVWLTGCAGCGRSQPLSEAGAVSRHDELHAQRTVGPDSQCSAGRSWTFEGQLSIESAPVVRVRAITVFGTVPVRN
jgi:hypothetical protein